MLRKKLNHSLPWNEDLHGRGLSSSNCCCAFFFLTFSKLLLLEVFLLQYLYRLMPLILKHKEE